MALSEFSLIRKYFSTTMPSDVLGPGDDAACLPMPRGAQLVVTKDLLIEGRHFLADVSPFSLGHKSLAVNLSDLAAMGAIPLGCLLGLGVQKTDPDWLKAFSEGFLELSSKAGCPLIGGDTVRAADALVLSVTAFGYLPEGQSGLLRSGAQIGDDVWVSGHLGAAHIALLGLQGDDRISERCIQETRMALELPQPRLALGQSLRGLANSAIDISDGLVQDLGHVLTASHCGAHVSWDALPIHPAVRHLPQTLQQEAVLGGGDVFELCFTAPVLHRDSIEALDRSLKVHLTRIGTIQKGQGLCVLDASGDEVPILRTGFDHFKDDE